MTQTLYQPGMVGETLVGYGENNVAATFTQIAAGVVVIKAAPGRLCQVLVTVATTAAQAITFYDNATAGSGTIIGFVPGAATAGTVFTFLMPANNGITIGQNASLAAGQITCSYT
jgi:hypothetical protein